MDGDKGLAARYLDRTAFDGYDDFRDGFRLRVPENFNFAYDVVDEWARLEPSLPALLWTDEHGAERRFTFGEMKELSDRTAAFFQSLGIGKGDRVMLMLKRRYQFWLSMMALHKLGAVAIPATHLLTEEDIEYRCRKAGIRMIVAAGEKVITDHVEKARPFCPGLEWTVSTGPEVPQGWIDFDSALEHAPRFRRPEHPNDNSDVMLLYFTSGTSGEPKMVAHDFTYPLGHIVTAAYWHNLRKGDLHLTLADTGWGKAVWGKLYGQWLCGAEVFVYDYDKFVPAELLAMMARYRINSFCAPPTVFRFLIRENVAAYDLSALRYCTIAGEALNPSVFERWKELTGISLMEGFGQTETTLTVGNFPGMTPKPGSMGRPNPQYDIFIADNDGNPVASGEQGEIVIRVPEGAKPTGLFKEYLDDTELTRMAWHDGLYHTGDVASLDDDGYFWFVGRKDDVIKSSGYRIGPFEVESACLTHPAVVECAITAVPDEVRGQIVKATIVLAKEYLKKAGPDLVKEIQDHVKRVTAPYKYPRVVEFVSELPKTISGKIRRVAIRATDAASSAMKSASDAASGAVKAATGAVKATAPAAGLRHGLQH
ncbi:MAG: AMP-binding protein [Muribaculaceae bacterium]|nr:AMP-binding protein [Muribaculaceae bacterium]